MSPGSQLEIQLQSLKIDRQQIGLFPSEKNLILDPSFIPDSLKRFANQNLQ
ncbi:hypothetical protein [Chamaesiphon sp. VAR_48_metabat_403]|uniref:hypothetical protein n=1 Tax=Chamaesiphon sp. VAR_48_metabat_403 TaxID=2964700 RepID=UPI00286D8DD3|nr:hypothetical protein [Chamaesiphon sp. VAR_48_metabat_403]